MSKNGVVVLCLLVFQGMLAAVGIGGPEAFGISQVAINWLLVINLGVGIALNRLDKLGGQNAQVETVERVVESPGKAPVVSTTVTTTESEKK